MMFGTEVRVELLSINDLPSAFEKAIDKAFLECEEENPDYNFSKRFSDVRCILNHVGYTSGDAYAQFKVIIGDE